MASSLTSLPEEMLIEIWSYLDFETKKVCTRVSKEWKKYIRGSERLSSEIYLKLEFGSIGSHFGCPNFGLSVEDINDVLSSWPQLKTLHVSSIDSISRPGILESPRLQIFGTTKFVENIASLIENDDSHNLAFHYNDAAFVADGNSSGIEFFRTCNILPFSCTHLALWRRQGKRPKVHAN